MTLGLSRIIKLISMHSHIAVIMCYYKCFGSWISDLVQIRCREKQKAETVLIQKTKNKITNRFMLEQNYLLAGESNPALPRSYDWGISPMTGGCWCCVVYCYTDRYTSQDLMTSEPKCCNTYSGHMYRRLLVLFSKMSSRVSVSSALLLNLECCFLFCVLCVGSVGKSKQ